MGMKTLLNYLLPPIVMDNLRMLRKNANHPSGDLLAPMDFLQKHSGDATAFISTSFLQKLLFYNDQMRELDSVPGDIMEFGVYRGDTLCVLAHLSELIDQHRSSRQIVGFDTFSGFPPSANLENSRSETERKLVDRFSNTSVELLRRKLRDRKQDRITLIEGDVMETVPLHLTGWRNKIAMALIDVDLSQIK
jgi:hypothetical protein